MKDEYVSPPKPRYTGTVRFFMDNRGFGFITHPTGEDVFVHYSVISAEGFKTLSEGEVVEYELMEGPKGLNASLVIKSGGTNVNPA